MTGPGQIRFTNIWGADVGPESPRLYLFESESEGASMQSIGLRVNPRVMRTKLHRIAERVGIVDVVTIGTSRVEDGDLLAPVRDLVGSVCPLREIEPWPVREERPPGSGADCAEVPDERRLAAITHRLFDSGSKRQPLLLVSVWGGRFCIDRLQANGEPGLVGSYMPLISQRLGEFCENPRKRLSNREWRALVAEPAIRTALMSESRCFGSSPGLDYNEGLFEEQNLVFGWDIGPHDGMLDVWRLHHAGPMWARPYGEW